MNWTTEEWNEKLTQIFAKPKAPKASVLPEEMQVVVNRAETMGITVYPIILVNRFENGTEFCYLGGKVNLNTYDRFVIEVATHLETIFGCKERTVEEMTKTLCHEIGHVHALQNGENVYSEDYADSFISILTDGRLTR